MSKSVIIGAFSLLTVILGGTEFVEIQAFGNLYYDKDNSRNKDSLYLNNDFNQLFPTKEFEKKYDCKENPFTSSAEICAQRSSLPQDLLTVQSKSIIVPKDFPTIQSAVTESNPGDTIKVLPGVYTEQITIEKSLTLVGSGAKSTVINAPATLDTDVLGLPYIIEVKNGAEVNIKGFGINGLENTDCNDLLGISVVDEATINLHSSTITGCTGVGIQIGNAGIFPGGPQVGHATIENSFISNYLNVGVFASGVDSTVTMLNNEVVGTSPDSLGQVGILFILGATGNIVNNVVSGNICNHPDCGSNFFDEIQAFGIAADSSGVGSVISNNLVVGNDIGIGVGSNSGCCEISNNNLKDNIFFGIVIVNGEHTVSKAKIAGGNIGVAAIAINSDTIATLDKVKIDDSTTPVEELSCCGFTAEVISLPN